MKLKLIIAASAVALSGLAASAPAQANSVQVGIHGSHGSIHASFGNDRHGPNHGWNDRRGHRFLLAPWEVRRQLVHRGFRNIWFVDTHAPVYKARATTRHGRRVFLVLNARTGSIIRATRIARR